MDTPEEKIKREFWYVLQRIKEESLRAKTSDIIDYDVYQNVIGGDGPIPKNEIKVLQKLEQLGIIRILLPEIVTEYDAHFKLHVIYPEFDKLYITYKRGSDDKIRQVKSTGIFNTGKDNAFIDNEFSGLDIGIKDEGEGTLALGNKFKENGGFKNSQININSQVHYGKGNNEGNKNNGKEGEGFLSKFFWIFIIGILVIVISGLVSKKFFGT